MCQTLCKVSTKEHSLPDLKNLPKINTWKLYMLPKLLIIYRNEYLTYPSFKAL